MKKLLFLLFFLLCFSFTYSQHWELAKTVSSGYPSRIINTAVDNFGNFFLLGYLDTGKIYETTSLDSGIYIAKFQNNGNFLWAKSISKALNANFDTDVNGNAIVLGTYADSFTYDQLTIQSSGNNDIFLVKIDSRGQGVWLKSFGGTQDDIGSAIVTDSLSIYITGTISLNAAFGNLILNDTSPKIQYTCKLNSNGLPAWVEKAAYENSGGLDISIGENGNIYTVGIINCNRYSSWDYCDQYMQKFSSSGVSMLTYVFGAPLDPSDIICRGDQIYIYQSSCTPGACFSFLTKYNAQMNQIWSRSMGSSFSDYWCGNVQVGLDKSIYVTGTYGFYNTSKDSIQFDSIWIQKDHQKASNRVIARIDSNGIFKMVTPFYLNNGYDINLQMSVSNNYDCYLAGSLIQQDTATFGEHTLNCISKGFIAQYSNLNGSTINNVSAPFPGNICKDDFTIYPNPVSNSFTINYFSKVFSELILRVKDSNGRLIFSDSERKFIGQNIRTVNLPNQPRGIYFIEILQGNSREVKKLVLE